jgi:predicted transcriptional regulator
MMRRGSLEEAAVMATTDATAKRDVEELLSQLPDECTLEDIQYHLYVLEKIRRGEADLDAGRSLTHDEARSRMQRWRQG